MKWPRIDPAAVKDIKQALLYFAQQGPALEAAFAKSLKSNLSQIAKSPRRYARLETNETDREIRRVILHRFRYLVIYELVHDIPHVVAVMHASQQPDYWQTRQSDN